MRRRDWLGGAALTALIGRAIAQADTAGPFATSWVRTGLYRIAGPGGNTLVRFSNAGMLLVDGQPADAYRPLMAALRRLNRIGDLPLRAVALTSNAPAHAGTHLQFLAQGVDVVAHRVAAARLPAAAVTPGRRHGQVVVFDDEQALHLGAVLARIVHVGAARSDSDSIVHFADLGVVAVGDLFVRGDTSLDAEAGTRAAGWLRALDRILAIDAELHVPGDGEPVTRAAIQALRRRVAANGQRAT